MSLSIIILAAGFGSRMKSEKAKVLHKISGKSMIYFSIKEALKITQDIHIVLNHQKDIIKDYIDNEFKDNSFNFHIQDIENFPGTGGALRGINSKYNKILVLNGDMPLIEETELKKFLNIESDITLSILKLKNPNGYGRVIIDKDNFVEKIVEEKDASDEVKKVSTVNAGVYLFSKKILDEYLPKLDANNAQKEYYLTDIISLAKNDNKTIKSLVVNEENFKGINTKYDLALANDIMQNRIKKSFMIAGVSMNMPNTIYMDYGVKIDNNSSLENGVTLLGDKTEIINSNIKTGSVIENGIIKNSSIGPLARIRPDSKIIDSHIGNFVEVKKSTLNNIKAGHLSYLGDAKIDSGTNIGAGVITCNYDGKNKYKTIIGKNVFIGSDTQLIAPIKIEDDVIIGAGSTINKDLTGGVLAISRTPIKIVKNFFYKFFQK